MDRRRNHASDDRSNGKASRRHVAYSVREVLWHTIVRRGRNYKIPWNEGVVAAREIQLLILLTDSNARALTDSALEGHPKTPQPFFVSLRAWSALGRLFFRKQLSTSMINCRPDRDPICLGNQNWPFR